MLPHSTHSWLLSVVPETNSGKVVDKRLHCSESNCCIAHPGVPVGRNVWPCLFLDMKGLSDFQAHCNNSVPMGANFLLSSSCAYRQGLGLHPIHPHVPAMQAHFNPNAAADSCAVLAESWANGVVEMWFVVCATAPLLVEHPRPQTQPQMGWGFLCHCSWIRLWPRSFGFWQFWQPFRKSEPWRLFASRICTCLEVATWCCRTQHIADCQAQSQEQIVPKKGANGGRMRCTNWGL